MSEHMNGSPEDATAFSRRMASVSSAAPEPQVPQVPPAAQVAQDDPLVVLREAALAVDLSRATARQCRSATAEARSAFSAALTNWNRSQPIQSQESALRAFVNQSQADRAARAARGLLSRPATVSQTAKAYSGGGHNVQRGHGRAYARGAVSQTTAMETTALRRRAETARMNGSNAPRVKLPSER